MLKLSDLAVRSDLQLGPMLVSPSRRLVEGPSGHVHVEPLIMQVFLLLLDARGKVVTRTELFDRCWGGVIVGDDSLNRAIAKVRRTGAQVAPGLFEIETIPRTGYRLKGEILEFVGGESRQSTGNETPATSRRMILGAGIATAAALGIGSLWWTSSRDRTDPRFAALMQRGEDSLRLDGSDAAAHFREALAMDPRNARAWGLLAYALGTGIDGPSSVAGPTMLASERAARTALRIDPDEPNALLAMTFVRSHTLDRFDREQRYRQILTLDPDNTLVMRSLGQFLHSVGRCRESLAIVERAVTIEPLSPDHQARRAMRLWAIGREVEADRAIDRAMGLWPLHRIVRLARLMIYAFTGRAHAALAMVAQEEKKPILLTPATIPVWRASLAALVRPTASSIAAARDANIEGAKSVSAIAAWAILVLSALRELDAAFEVAEGFLLSRGSIIVRPQPETMTNPARNAGWRNTFGLFVPPTRAMRLDPRFGPLADGLGLTEYWRTRGIGPDAFLFET